MKGIATKTQRRAQSSLGLLPYHTMIEIIVLSTIANAVIPCEIRSCVNSGISLLVNSEPVIGCTGPVAGLVGPVTGLVGPVTGLVGEQSHRLAR